MRATPSERLCAMAFNAAQTRVCRAHLRRDALTPAHEKIEGVGGNGAAIQTGDPEGRERSHTGYADV